MCMLFVEVECVSVSDAARKHMSPRQQVFMELVQTESNYVGILHTIVTVCFRFYLFINFSSTINKAS